MQTKLTLRMESDLIENAKRYARDRGTSLSQMVAHYFQALTSSSEQEPEEGWKRDLGPITQSLIGLLEDAELDEGDYYRYLEAKHLGGRSGNRST